MPHHLTSRQSLRCTRRLDARWRDFDFLHCRDLIRLMVEADPVARASLERCSLTGGRPDALLGAYKAANVTTHAALRWPEKVDHVLFRAPADDAWRKQNLADILELVARLCEAPNTRRPT